jgi:hypothetical protein
MHCPWAAPGSKPEVSMGYDPDLSDNDLFWLSLVTGVCFLAPAIFLDLGWPKWVLAAISAAFFLVSASDLVEIKKTPSV